MNRRLRALRRRLRRQIPAESVVDRDEHVDGIIRMIPLGHRRKIRGRRTSG